MQKEELPIFQEFADKIRITFPKAMVLAFGSYTRGTATSDSDLDICVVIPQMKQDDRLVISDIAWEVGFKNDLHISTIVISENDYKYGPFSASPLRDTIQNEGVAA